MSALPPFKTIVVGDGCTGKTTFVTRHVSGEFRKQYIATIGVEIRQIPFTIISQRYPQPTEVVLNFYDTAGQEKFGGLRDGYYIDSDACLLFFDVTSRTSYKNVETWYRDVVRICPSRADKLGSGEPKPLAVVLVGNKCDSRERQVRSQNVRFHRTKNIPYVEISAKSNFNYEAPIILLLKSLLEDTTVQFSQAPALAVPDLLLNDEEKKRMLAQLEVANYVPLPDED